MAEQGERMTELKLDKETRERIARELQLAGTDGIPEKITFTVDPTRDVAGHGLTDEAKLRLPA